MCLPHSSGIIEEVLIGSQRPFILFFPVSKGPDRELSLEVWSDKGKNGKGGMISITCIKSLVMNSSTSSKEVLR